MDNKNILLLFTLMTFASTKFSLGMRFSMSRDIKKIRTSRFLRRHRTTKKHRIAQQQSQKRKESQPKIIRRKKRRRIPQLMDKSAQQIQPSRKRVIETEEEGEMVTCIICTNVICNKQTLQCGHEYCFACIKKWFIANDKCPECRAVDSIFKQKVEESLTKTEKDEREEDKQKAIEERIITDGRAAQELYNSQQDQDETATLNDQSYFGESDADFALRLQDEFDQQKERIDHALATLIQQTEYEQDKSLALVRQLQQEEYGHLNHAGATFAKQLQKEEQENLDLAFAMQLQAREKTGSTNPRNIARRAERNARRNYKRYYGQ